MQRCYCKARKIRGELKTDVIRLTAIEIVEFLTPIAYSITFAMAFYGPNADIIGGVKFANWQYHEVTNIWSYLIASGMMFFADLTCLVASGLILWKFASVNMFEQGYKLLTFYWPLLAINMAGTFFIVSILYLISIKILYQE